MILKCILGELEEIESVNMSINLYSKKKVNLDSTTIYYYYNTTKGKIRASKHSWIEVVPILVYM